MRIAIISPLSYPVPPKHYGGIEIVVYYLVEGLKKRGHDVTLFAPMGSKVSVKIDDKYSKRIVGDSIAPENISYATDRVRYIADISSEFDLIHNNDGFLALEYQDKMKCPLVSTWHVPIKPRSEQSDKELSLFKRSNIISISMAQRKNFSDTNYVGNVYNGTVDFDEYSLGAGGDYLVWIGRFDPYKGAKEAIKVAKKSGYKLVLAGKVETDRQKEYFRTYVEPEVDNQSIIFAGQIGVEEKVNWLKKSKAFLMPISWEEPFGLVMVEAMRCGTPVVAFDRGSVREVVKDGETGFVVKPDDIEAMAEAVGKLDRIDRATCRRHVIDNFSIDRMVDGYEEVYKKVLEGHKK